jgi:hypothetical protein
MPGLGNARAIQKFAIRLQHRMIVDEKLQILADHEHVEQLFVDNLEGGYRPVLPRIVYR